MGLSQAQTRRIINQHLYLYFLRTPALSGDWIWVLTNKQSCHTTTSLLILVCLMPKKKTVSLWGHICPINYWLEFGLTETETNFLLWHSQVIPQTILGDKPHECFQQLEIIGLFFPSVFPACSESAYVVVWLQQPWRSLSGWGDLSVCLWALCCGLNLQARQTASKQTVTFSCIFGNGVTLRSQKTGLWFGEGEKKECADLNFWGVLLKWGKKKKRERSNVRKGGEKFHIPQLP